ncbi:hypothetical protein EJB05_09545, partial [Eragrostis curvula]
MARDEADGKGVQRNMNSTNKPGEDVDAAIAKRRAQNNERQKRWRARQKATPGDPNSEDFLKNVLQSGNVNSDRARASSTTPFGKQGICGDDNHGTSQPSQLSVLTGNVEEARVANSTRRPLRDITNIEAAGGKENQAVKMHGNKGIKRQKKGIVGEGDHGTPQPSQLSGLTGNIKEARL